MTLVTARKKFWDDWHTYKEHPKKREFNKFLKRMKTELGYNQPTQIEVERLMRMEITKINS